MAGGRDAPPCLRSAQAIRAILLAKATAATLVGRRAITSSSQGWFAVPRLLACRITVIAPATSSHRRYGSPCLEILPRRCFPPVEFCRGTSPIQAAISRPDLNTEGSAMEAANALAVTGPTPGMVARRWLTASDRCQA